MNKKIIDLYTKIKTLKQSLSAYGIQGLTVAANSGSLRLEQILGQGIRGLGYDKGEGSLWLCLDQKDPASIANNAGWLMGALQQITIEL